MRLRDWWEMMACYAGGMAAADQRHRVPQPFLGPLFAPGVEPLIATGFHYTRREIEVHGVETHNAIDFDLPRGTPVLAPADGYYVATYGEVLIRDKHGEPVTRSLAEAKAGNPHNRDFRPPQHGQRWPIYYGSFVVQGWHGRGRYTQYAHLDAVDPHIPYYPPSESEQGDLHFSPTLRASVREYGSGRIGAWLKAGDRIGVVGMTGCGWGARCYDAASFDAADRPDFSRADYTYYTSPHLHFMVFGARRPRSRKPSAFWDPFGIYGDLYSGYPDHRSEWSAEAGALWLPNS
jgi:murein DD-endopeptidase MepM/ murein hydrolase activator NlpD